MFLEFLYVLYPSGNPLLEEMPAQKPGKMYIDFYTSAGSREHFYWSFYLFLLIIQYENYFSVYSMA